MTNTTNLCPQCGGPAHDVSWRCEACRALFTCAAAFTQEPGPVTPVTMHGAFPVVGYRPDGVTGTMQVPVLGELVSCGPVVLDAGPSLTERALALARSQKERPSLKVVADR